ncbi:MAG TPA: hypothetical protein VN844_22140 [Pyrinomonadaceae bacterium]|nr:hypothetical protein [Pyrinomonadaceae bacterium]
MAKKIFVSVGKTSTPEQEEFVKAIEDRMRAEGLTPCTVGRNYWTAGAPLKKVIELMRECSGVVIIALERTYFPAGVERRGHPEAQELKEVRLPTPYNQVEAAMAYCYGHPLLVIVEDSLRTDGLLEKGNDWYVQHLKPHRDSLTTVEFNGILASWKDDLSAPRPNNGFGLKPATETKTNVSEMSVAQLVGSLKPVQLWALLAAIAALIVGAFSLGAKLIGR